MIPIPKPFLETKDLFEICISKVKNKTLKVNLAKCSKTIVEKSNDYETHFVKNEIFIIPQDMTVLDSIGKEEMIKVYKNGMLPKNMPGRIYYDQIRGSALDGNCPLCSIRPVSTVDHYLAKALYPVFAVTPINLIPACGDCNGDKKARFPKTNIDQTLHPYFDNVNNENWIKASVLKTSPVSVYFYPDPPTHWDDVLKQRAIYHFESFDLNGVFSSNANRRLQGTIKTLKNQYDIHPDVLKSHLLDAYESNLCLGVNSFEVVLFYTLLNDDWFTTIGISL
jgi:hypothetical protein